MNCWCIGFELEFGGFVYNWSNLGSSFLRLNPHRSITNQSLKKLPPDTLWLKPNSGIWWKSNILIVLLGLLMQPFRMRINSHLEAQRKLSFSNVDYVDRLSIILSSNEPLPTSVWLATCIIDMHKRPGRASRFVIKFVTTDWIIIFFVCLDRQLSRVLRVNVEDQIVL